MSKPISLVVGASEKPDRYSNKAVRLLRAMDHPVYALGQKPGQIGDVPIATEWPADQPIDTITLYLNPQAQAAHVDQILHLKPRRIVFNPGTENETLAEAAQAAGIQTLEACTLVMLHTGQY